MIKVSFIVPVYNVEMYLHDCLLSLVSQTYSNIEIILINDGSTDNSLKILEEFSKKDNRIIIINQENAGLSTARNVGLECAHGDYLFFVDSDDYVSLDAAEKIAKAIQMNGKLDILNFSLQYIFPNNVFKDDMLFIPNNRVLKGKVFLMECISKGCFRASVCRKVFRRKYLLEKKIKFQPGMLYEDLLFSITSHIYANAVSSISDILYYYRRTHVNSITNSISPRDIDVIKTVEAARTLLLKSDNQTILESAIWQIFIFKWVANATFFKYPVLSFTSIQGWRNCRYIKQNKTFRPYIKATKKYASNRNLRISASLIYYNLPLFYIIRKISKMILPTHNF